MDKNTVKPKGIPLETPYSAATLHRFLSDHPKDAGVKIDGAFKAPVLKVRSNGPKKLDDAGREAWRFYLLYLHQRLVGTEEASKAGEEIETLLKKETLKLSVGALLVPLDALMKAEQARLAGANSLVRRWLANEKGVQDIAIGHGRDGEPKEKLEREKSALETACKFLARFSDCKDGEIDTNRILDEAYGIGHQLSKEDINSLAIARHILIGKKKEMSAFIGEETASFLDLCVSANGKEKKDFRSDTNTKTVVGFIAAAMRARTDNDEYLIPASPRTIASRTNMRASIPEFTAADTTTPEKAGRRASGKEEEKHEASTTPPRKTPPATPRRGSPDEASSLARGHSASDLVSPPGTRRNAPALTTASHPSGMGAAVRELQGIQRPALRKVIASPVEQGSTTNMVASPLASSSPDTTAPSTPDKPRQLRRSSMRSRTPSSEDSRSGQAGAVASEPGSEKKAAKEARRKRGLEKESANSGASRQHSQGEEVYAVRTRLPHSVRSKHSSMPTPGGLDPEHPESVQSALAALKAVASAANADRLRPLIDTPVFRKWEAAEKELQSVLTLETSHAMRRILSFCHDVSLNPGDELASMQRVVKAARPRSKEIAALVGVRDILLAESRQQAGSKVSAGFPELLSMLVFLIDADRAWRQDRAAKGAD